MRSKPTPRDTPNKESFFKREGPTRAVFALSKVLPPGPAKAVIRTVARVLITAMPANCRGAADNLRHILPPHTSETERSRTLYRLLYNSGRSYYHLFHNLAHGRDFEELRPPVLMADNVRRQIEEAVRTGRGLFLIGTHTSNFDLAGIGMTYYLPKPVQVLSIANPTSGYRYLNRMRKTEKGFVTPITPASLRQAIRRLREGGIVMTSGDRPIAEGNHPVAFFGQTAYLPTGYLRIPLATEALVMTIAFYYDGTAYWVLGGPVTELERTGDRKRDIEANAQLVLAQIEPFIRRAPDQWMVFEPIFATASAAKTPLDTEG